MHFETMEIDFNIIIWDLFFTKKRVSNSVVCPNDLTKIIHSLLMTAALKTTYLNIFE